MLSTDPYGGPLEPSPGMGLFDPPFHGPIYGDGGSDYHPNHLINVPASFYHPKESTVDPIARSIWMGAELWIDDYQGGFLFYHLFGWIIR